MEKNDTLKTFKCGCVYPCEDYPTCGGTKITLGEPEKEDKPNYINKEIKKVSEVDLKAALIEVNQKNKGIRDSFVHPSDIDRVEERVEEKGENEFYHRHRELAKDYGSVHSASTLYKEFIAPLQSENTRLSERVKELSSLCDNVGELTKLVEEHEKMITKIESMQRSDLPIFYNQAILEVVSVLKGKPVGYAKETLKPV